MKTEMAMAGLPSFNMSKENQLSAWESFLLDYKILIRSEGLEDA